METRDAYNRWAKTYDSVANKTRDLESIAIRAVLKDIKAGHILEIGCGTGKNTSWLARRAQQLTAVDFSEDMLRLARQKIKEANVAFKQADITHPWTGGPADLIACSLVLEHIHDLDFIFQQAAVKLNPGGHFYICELHPYKQRAGSRARFEEDGETFHLEYFIHHISEYMASAFRQGLTCRSLMEWFDQDKPERPRLISFLFQKSK